MNIRMISRDIENKQLGGWACIMFLPEGLTIIAYKILRGDKRQKKKIIDIANKTTPQVQMRRNQNKKTSSKVSWL